MKTEITVSNDDECDLPEEYSDQWNTMLDVHVRVDLLLLKNASITKRKETVDTLLAQVRDSIFDHLFNRYPESPDANT